MKQYDPAISSYNAAIVLDAKNPDAVNGLGEVYVEQKNLVLARKQQTALQLLNAEMAARLLLKINAVAPKTPLKRPARKR